MNHIDTVVIGGGQAGLVTSHYLKQVDREHVVLEKERIGKAWRDERWDSFTLVTPNWQLQLPELPYEGDDPDGFLTRQEMVQYLDRFVELCDPPVREGVEVMAVDAADDSEDLIVRSTAGDYQAANVVVAAGTFQKPKIPNYSGQLSEDVYQIHTKDYRNPDQLPKGAVLVVGGGQSGCQIAEELFENGREVHLSTSQVGRLPRRYRGEDSMRWLARMGFLDRTVEQLDSKEERFAPNPRVSGKDGGHTISLHRFYRDGIILLGHMVGANGTQLEFAPDLKENLKAADQFAKEIKAGVDKFIEKKGLEAPKDDQPELRDAYEAPVVTELDLESAGIGTVLWATGYSFDFSWVKFPVFDEYGYPLGTRGVTPQPGLYFVGLHWLHTIKSGLLIGVGDDANHVVTHIESRSE